LVSPGQEFVIGRTTFEVLQNKNEEGRRTATCTAVDFVQLVRISADVFADILKALPDVAADLSDRMRLRLLNDHKQLSRMESSVPVSLEQELMQGQNVLLLDLNKCTRCDECVKACVAAHEDGETRLVRDGVRFDNFLVPTSCRACLDPLCMMRCP